MSAPIQQRKNEVIDIILSDPLTDRHGGAFDGIRLKHRALPEINLKDVDPSITFMGHRLSFPLMISPMTGGAHDRLGQINRNLAAAAEAEGVAMGVGSQRVMLLHPDARPSFMVRPHAPSILLFANFGAVQLNHGFGPDQARQAVREIGADALYLHLNPLQEAVQPEGETEFAGLADRIGGLARELEVPVVAREVGAGLSPEDLGLLFDRGIRFFDVAGWGGTSWSRVEHQRRPAGSDDTLGLTFQDWGLPTPEALEAARPLRRQGATLIASGGLRNGLDMAKAVVLGASLCGMAAPFLAPALESVGAVRALIRRLRREYVTALFLMGAARTEAVADRRDLIWSWARAPRAGES